MALLPGHPDGVKVEPPIEGYLTSKPNPPIAPRAKRLAPVIDKQGIRGDDQTNGEDGYGYGYEH